MLKWNKVGIEVNASGEKTITYECPQLKYIKIESRKRNIPHANGTGTWSHTSYFAINVLTGEEREFMSLKDAKEYVEVR